MKLTKQLWLGRAMAISALAMSVRSLYGLILYVGKPQTLCAKDDPPYFFSLASIAGFLLSWWVLRQMTNYWLQSLARHRKDIGHFGEWIAIAAMSIAMPALILTVSSLPRFTPLFRVTVELGRETAAIQTLRSIHNNQSQYEAMKRRFGTLNELACQGLIETVLADGKPVYGYHYNSSDITRRTYCVRAYRSNSKCGGRDFIVCEDGDIRYVESPTITVLKRGEGKLLAGQNDPAPSPTP